MLPYAAALALNDSRLFVTNQDDGSVSVIDTATLKEIALIEVGNKPEVLIPIPMTGMCMWLIGLIALCRWSMQNPESGWYH